MTRLLVLAEGASEELFVNTVLSPHLQRFGVFPRATGVITRRLASGKKTTGGNLWPNVRLSLRPLLADSDAWVTTLLDYYGLPEDFPGVAEAARLTAPPLERVRHVEQALGVALGGPPRWIPFLALHEFEAWYFVTPARVAEFFGNPGVAETMERICREAGGPEDINDGKETHPSKRLQDLGIGFRKTSAVPVLQDIGLDAIRGACPHFDSWLTRLERLGSR